MDRLLTPDVGFRGSLGQSMKGRDEFWAYVSEVRGALADYKCDIVELVTEPRSAAARMVFSGTHVGDLLGRPPTGLHVQWTGAAFFHTRGGRINDVWVLGDMDGLRTQLEGDMSKEIRRPSNQTKRGSLGGASSTCAGHASN